MNAAGRELALQRAAAFHDINADIYSSPLQRGQDTREMAFSTADVQARCYDDNARCLRHLRLGNLRQQAALLHEGDDAVGEIVWAFVECVENQFGIARRLVGRIQPGEIAQFATSGLFIETLWIALFADIERSVDKYFNEFIQLDEFTRHHAVCPERRDEGDK